jgi:antitoxin PrlF
LFDKESFAMSQLTVTAKGQVTLRKDLLRHLGVAPGQKIEAQELPGGRIEIRAAHPAGDISNFIGLLAGKSKKIATIEEIEEAAASGWAEGE